VNARDGPPCHGVWQSGSAGVSRIADCAELNITFGGSEVFEPLDDVFAGVPAAFTFRAGSGRCAAFDRIAHLHDLFEVKRRGAQNCRGAQNLCEALAYTRP
jgi:hypothetical protein